VRDCLLLSGVIHFAAIVGSGIMGRRQIGQEVMGFAREERLTGAGDRLGAAGGASEATPERTAFVRFRRELVRRRLDRLLFNEVVRRIDARGLTVRTGTLVDATMVRAASDGDGRAG
jgi:hypothetical protein